jgi:hypothetical protein
MNETPNRVITDLIDDVRDAVREIENGCHPLERRRVYRDGHDALNAALEVIENIPVLTPEASAVLAAALDWEAYIQECGAAGTPAMKEVWASLAIKLMDAVRVHRASAPEGVT